MSKKPNKAKDLFSPEFSKPLTPHDRTNAAARAIIETEAQQRAEKTARLRAIRLGQDESDDPQAQAAPSKKA